MFLNNNIIIKRLIKVALLPKFFRDLNKLEEYLNKTQIYINYILNRFKKEYQKTFFTMSYLEDAAFKYLCIYYKDFILQKDLKLQKPNTIIMFRNFDYYYVFIRRVYSEPYRKEKDLQQLLNLKITRLFYQYTIKFIQYVAETTQNAEVILI